MNVIRYWNDRYLDGKGSGKGSRGRQANRKAAHINRLIRQRHVGSVIDWGCGDGRVASRIHVGRYVGVDVSEAALGLARAAADGPGRSWHLYDGRIAPPVGTADLALSLDVIFHLVDDDLYRRHLELVFGSAPLVCIHASNRDEAGREHVLHREWTRDVPAGWRILTRPTDERELGFWVLAKERQR